jgi:hypothetical protein
VRVARRATDGSRAPRSRDKSNEEIFACEKKNVDGLFLSSCFDFHIARTGAHSAASPANHTSFAMVSFYYDTTHEIARRVAIHSAANGAAIFHKAVNVLREVVLWICSN